MSWNGQGNMGVNSGGGGGLAGLGGDMSGGMQGNASNQPHATEYTLQGVMRFLQTEWHRHERERNAWEIEKQEMKGRIAALEGSTRRADATQKALKKYVSILEKKVKEQATQLKSSTVSTSQVADIPPETTDKHRQAAKLLAKLRGDKDPKSTKPGDQTSYVADDENQRVELRTFLDQCQAEFTYLMITPANPIPPRDSLPLVEDFRDEECELSLGQQQTDQYNQPANSRSSQPNARQPSEPANVVGTQMLSSVARNIPPRSIEHQPTTMSRSVADSAPSAYGSTPSDWTPQAQTTDLVTESRVGANNAGPARRDFASEDARQIGEPDDQKTKDYEADSWDFNDGAATFAEPGLQALQQTSTSSRPDTDAFPVADGMPKSPNRLPHRRKSSASRRRSAEYDLTQSTLAQKAENGAFKLRFGLRGHLDTVRAVIFSGGGSPGEPEICTAADDGLIKRFHIPRANYMSGVNSAFDLDIQADFTHRGHHGAVLCLASWSAAPNFATGGRAQGDGWIFSGGQDNFIRVWERGRVDPKATLDGHTDAVWALCVLPATLGSVFGRQTPYGSADRILLISGAADGTVRVWALSAPPQLASPQPLGTTNRRGGAGAGGRVRGNSMSSGSSFPSSPQPTIASSSPFHYTLVHTITRPNSMASPTCITALGGDGGSFAVSYSDAAIIVYDTRTGEEIGAMASLETYNGTFATSVNAVVATTVGLEKSQPGDEDIGSSGSLGGPTGGGRASGVEGVIISGHEDRFIRFFDANSGQCTYNMLAHPAAISSLSLSPDGRELVSAGHDASLRFWSLEKRSCTQEVTSHRIMRGEGVCSVVWSQDGRWVVSGGGDGVVKIFAR